MIIDFHCHTFPDSIAAAAIKKMQMDCHAAAFSEGTLHGLKSTAASAGIDWSVIQPVATKPEQVSAINRLATSLNGKDGVIYFGAMHPDFEDAATELKFLADSGIRGIKIHPVYQKHNIDHISYLHIFEICAELGLWVLSHTGDDIGFPDEVSCSPEKCRRALKAVPGLKFVAAHMGGWRTWDRVADCLLDTEAFIDTAFSLGFITTLEDGFYDGKSTALLDEAEFCGLVRTFGSKRVLFGTDTPWTDRKKEIANIKALPLSEGEIFDILGANAELILFKKK